MIGVTVGVGERSGDTGVVGNGVWTGGGSGVGVLVGGAGVGVKVRVGTVCRSGLCPGAAQIAGIRARTAIEINVKIQKIFPFIALPLSSLFYISDYESHSSTFTSLANVYETPDRGPAEFQK